MSLFAEYLKALEPESIFEVVPEELLQLLMRGFFFADRRGVTLLFPNGNGWGDLEPKFLGRREIQNNWNHFCRKLRKLPHCDAACRACDQRVAAGLFTGAVQSKEGYSCHMQLRDFAFRLEVAGRPAGVLFAGQIAESDWNEATVVAFRRRLGELVDTTPLTHAANNSDSAEASVAIKLALENPERARKELIDLLESHRSAAEEVNAFREGFEKLCKDIQKLIDERYEARLTSAQRAAVIRANECYSRQVTDQPDAWTQPADRVLDGLEYVLRGRPLFLLVRRRSHYRVMAASPRCVALMGSNWRSGTGFRVPVARGFDIGERDWTRLARENDTHGIWRKALPWIKDCEIWGYRVDQTSVANTPLSVILVACGAPHQSTDIVRKHRQTFVENCVDVLVYHANIGTVFDRLHIQQEEFARRVSYVGHHLKTPLQNAFATLGDIRRLGDSNAVEQIERQRLCTGVVRQLQEAQADALMLQSTTKAQPVRNDLIKVLQGLIQNFESRAAEKGNPISLESDILGSTIVSAVPAHLRMAFSNLIDNAVKYSFWNQPIKIVVVRTGTESYATVRITSFGQGFTERDRPNLFRYAKRVVREDRFKKRPGSGIGLTQAANLLEQGGSSLDIESHQVAETRDGTPLHRTTAVIVVPLVPTNS
ncbi:MAG TPA: PocR ligand-binding domain-containing protein [Lacunisphaera sp.]|nr:PocR ligand-binding domain-containing protein [Lacunisphaera sp.]